MSSRAARGPLAWPSLLVLIAVGILVYANSLGGVFLYDDFDSITDNPHIRSLWPLSEAMSRPLADAAETVSTRPLLSLTFALNHRLLGNQAWGFHVVNVVIHIAAALLLFAVIRRALLGDVAADRLRRHATGLAMATALLWLVHPLNTSSVTYIVQRAESLAGMLFLLALFSAQRALQGYAVDEGGDLHSVRNVRNVRAWQAATVVICALGMAAKETMWATPLVIFLYDAAFVAGSYRECLVRRWPWYAAMLATWAIIVALLSADTGELVSGGEGLRYALTQPGVILYYLRLALWPHPLVMSYEWPLAVSAGAVVVPAAFVLALIAVTAWGVARRSWFGVVGAAFFLVLAPSSSVFALTQRIMEHRMYLPLACVVLLVVLAVAEILRRVSDERTRLRAAVALSAAITVVLATLTIERNVDYQDEIAFWSDNTRHRPESYIAHLQLGRAYMKRAEPEPARASFARAIAIEPGFSHLRNDMGRALLGLGDRAGARVELEKAIRLEPGLAVAHNNLGIVYERGGHLERAAGAFEHALELEGELAIARENLSRVHATLGAALGDRGGLERALASNPDDVLARTRFAALLEREGKFDAARREYQRALTTNPDYTTARNAMATLLARQGRFDEAAPHFLRVLEAEPDDVVAHANLAALYASQGRDDDAVVHFEHVLRLEPERALANFNMGLLLENGGDLETAAHYYRSEIRINPSFAIAHASLGRVLESSGKRDEAAVAYARALELDADLKIAAEGLTRTR